jgi:hypothetical protein
MKMAHDDKPLVHDQPEANARLIAAAPDLLAACKLAAQYSETIWEDEMQKIVAAIAKAEGK